MRRGTITVFLSLISVLLLSLICTLVESARVQACRSRAAAVTQLGLFSVFGEFEKMVLDDYDLFFLDGALGSGEFGIHRVEKKFRDYMEQNIEGTSGLLPLSVSQCSMEGYALATDEGGQVFYRQAVKNQKEILVPDLLQEYQTMCQDVKRQEEAGKNCEQGSQALEGQIKELWEQAEEQRAKEVGQADAEVEAGPSTFGESGQGKNPLDVIKEIKKMGILGLVMKEPGQVSGRQVDKGELPSVRKLRKGTLEELREDPGWESDALFLQYLKTHFGRMTMVREGGGLAYELEYILAGKSSDMENLKGAVHRLLLVREGSNFLYAVSNEEMKQQALFLAAALVGGAAVPGLATAVQMALLAAWAYGESLLDVRILLAGGRVPMVKTGESWRLTLDQLGNLTQALAQCDEGGGEGFSYEDYLWMLLAAGKKQEYPMRALDLLECRMRGREETEKFRADACLVRVEARVRWEIHPMFLRVASAFLGTGEQKVTIETRGIFGY